MTDLDLHAILDRAGEDRVLEDIRDLVAEVRRLRAGPVALMPHDESREYGAADETGVPTRLVDAVLARWAATMPAGYTATDALRAADTSYMHETRNLARLAVLEVQDQLQSESEGAPTG